MKRSAPFAERRRAPEARDASGRDGGGGGATTPPQAAPPRPRPRSAGAAQPRRRPVVALAASRSAVLEESYAVQARRRPFSFFAETARVQD